MMFHWHLHLMVLCGLIALSAQVIKSYTGLKYSHCVSPNVTQMLNVALTDLDTGREVTQVQKDGNYRFSALFVPQTSRGNKVWMRLSLMLGDTEVRLPFFRKRNFCTQPSSSLDCPLTANKINSFTWSVHIPSQTPSFNGTLQLKLINENREKILCTLFPLIVIERTNKVRRTKIDNDLDE